MSVKRVYRYITDFDVKINSHSLPRNILLHEFMRNLQQHKKLHRNMDKCERKMYE